MSSPLPNCENIIASITEFYNLLIKLPYIDPNCLVLPRDEKSDNGWPLINEPELRRRGKTDEIIELMRHLPYLRQPAKSSKGGDGRAHDSKEHGKKWMIGPDTVAVAYADGEVYHENMDEIQPTPGHCIWLTDLVDGNTGSALLLDTHTGTITEYSTHTNNIVIDISNYEELPLEDRWMAYPTWPVADFFRLWARKYETLTWMAVYDDNGKAGTAQWYVSSQMDDDNEEESWDSDDESYVPDSDDDSSEDDDEYEWDSECDSGDDYELSDDGGWVENDCKKEPDWLKNTSRLETPNLVEAVTTQEDEISPETKTTEVYGIYVRNGWPFNFDREKCRHELEKFVDRTKKLVTR